MPARDGRALIAARVRNLAEEGVVQLPAGISADMGEPLAVHEANGAIHSWVVPFVADNRLVAWAQIGRALELLRFSLLAGGRVQASPDAADWIDPGRIATRIANAAGAGSLVHPPVLTYDRDPSRLVWAAEVNAPDGTKQRWMAAGESVWRDTGAVEVTGGPPR